MRAAGSSGLSAMTRSRLAWASRNLPEEMSSERAAIGGEEAALGFFLVAALEFEGTLEFDEIVQEILCGVIAEVGIEVEHFGED